MAKRSKQLSFAEFGQRFIEHAVTAETIRGSLAQIVPPEQQILLTSPTVITVTARTTVGQVAQVAHDAPDRELVFEAPLAVHLELAVDMLVGQERYDAVAAATLRLTARTLAPLSIYVDCDPVSADQITVASEGRDNWFDLVKRFGVLDDTIRQQVAGIINQQVEGSRRQRTIDVRKLIVGFAQASADGRASRRPRGRQKAPGEG